MFYAPTIKQPIFVSERLSVHTHARDRSQTSACLSYTRTRMQCDQMASLFLISVHLQQQKAAPEHNFFAKVGSKFCQTLNKPSTI